MTGVPLSPRELLMLWERAGQQTSNHARALACTLALAPRTDARSLSEVSLGRCNERFLAFWEQQFGSSLPLSGACPRCRVQLDLAFETSDLAPPAGAGNAAPCAAHRLEHGGWVVTFRLPNGADLRAAGACADAVAARSMLLDRCVLGATPAEGDAHPGSELPSELQVALEDAMEALDTFAVISIALRCPACSERWSAALDLAEAIWTEVAREARRSIADVAVLARRYHWSEASILAMSTQRRRMYLELGE